MTVTVCEPGSKRSIVAGVAGRERQRAVARLEHDAGRDVDLLAGLDVDGRQLVEADRRQGDVVDDQPALVALGEVDDDLGLLEHLHGVGRRGDRLDGVGQVGDLVAGDRAGEGEPDQHEADGDGQAGHQQLAVEPAVPRAIGRRAVTRRQHAGTRQPTGDA